MWQLDYKNAKLQRTDAFELWCWRRLLRVPWTARRPNQSILKEISLEYSLVGLMLNSNTLATWWEELTHLERPWCWESLQAEKGTTEDEMVGWYHWLARHEFQEALGVSDGQGSLVCCRPWSHIESNATELNWTWPSDGTVVKTCLPMQGCKRHRLDPWVRKIPWRRKRTCNQMTKQEAQTSD